MGVVMGFAGIKLSGSLNIKGLYREINIRIIIIKKNPIKSLKEKNGWNGILSILLLTLNGLLDPVWWRNIRWIIEKAKMMKGKMKWNMKKTIKGSVINWKPPPNSLN